jgi:hypothetical protein
MSNYYDLNVTLGYQSQEALKKINQNTKISFWLRFFLGAGGAFDSVFNTSAKEKMFVVTQTDFVQITKSIQAVNKLECALIKRIALERRMATYGDEKKFWERINDSCSIQ